MKAGDIALAKLQQADGQFKLRPVLLLKQFPPYGDWLICGISSQLRHEVSGFDNIINEKDEDFSKTGLQVYSLIRIGFLATLPLKDFPGTIGNVSNERYQAVLQNLIEHLNQ